ncbi:transcriptional regulator, TetR family [Bacillus sp. OV322]|nr:transcriptional regulator, TetR family [Bacillus sp. OV322]
MELIEENGLDVLTVKDITMRAKINRGTFYAHYQDKYECEEVYCHMSITEIVNIYDELLMSLSVFWIELE